MAPSISTHCAAAKDNDTESSQRVEETDRLPPQVLNRFQEPSSLKQRNPYCHIEMSSDIT